VITRRAFPAALGRGLFAAPLVADAQPADRIHRIGFLSGGAFPGLLDAFRQALRELGWAEGQNVVIDHRSAGGDFNRLPDLAAEVVRRKVDLIVAVPTATAVAAKAATATIPIVMINAGDPVGAGLVASLARPGGNVTGIAYGVGMDTLEKGWSCSRRPSPRCDAWPSSRTRRIPPSRSR
jgi:putative ABC transport system substrate-binding protein